MNSKEQSTVAMKKVRSFSVASLLLTIIPFASRAQAPTVQDCLGAIPICQQIYTESQSPTGTGNYPNEVNSDFSCSLSESNSIWYTFTVNQSGNFGFVINPNDRNDDYDWALFDITNATCADIYNNEALLVSCNAAGDDANSILIVCNGQTGATGASLYNIQGPGCRVDPPSNSGGYIRYNALIPVTSGNTYVLMVNNYTGSTNGYSINFGLSDAGVLDMEGPELKDAQFPTTCNQQTIALTFDENIQCGSLSAADFALTGPNGESYDLTLLPGICNSGATYAREFTLEVEQPIVENGTYTFTMTLDGSNDILDNCNNAAAGGVYTYNFEMNAPGLPVVELGNDRLSCDGQPVVLDATFDQSTYRWQDGSTEPTFSVTQTGTYRVTVTNACGETTDEVTITWLDGAPNIDLGADTVICAGTAFTLDATSDQSTYQWQNGSTNATLPVTAAGTYEVIVTNACGQTTDQINIEFVNSAPMPDFGEDIIGCGTETYQLDATSERATYVWQDGSTDPIFSANQSGLYSVTVTNACGQAIEGIEIALLNAPPVVELGPDTVLCTGANFVLDAASPQSTYQWQDGSTNATFPVTTAGTYAVTVTNACGPTTDQITVEFVREAPQTNLGDDIIGCQGETFTLDATAERATYRWQDGSTDPIFNATQSGLYSVTVTNVCGQIIEEIEIDLLDGQPVIDLGSDTVLCSGANFTLDATSPQSIYRWQDGSTNATFPVTAAGTYVVTVTNACGPTTDQITVEFVREAPQTNLGDDITGCQGETFTLDATAERATYRWQDGSTDAIFNATQSGTYSVTVTNVCGQIVDEIGIELLDGPPVVELGADTVLCTGANFILDATYAQSTYRWQDGSTNATFPVTVAGTYAVTVTNACGPTTDQITVEFVREAPQPDLGEDIVGCQGETFALDATSERATYLWQDGSTSAILNATQAGIYTVTVTNVCGQTTEEIEIELLDGPPVFELGPDTVLCAGVNFVLDAGSPQSTYQWQDGSTNASFPVTTAGIYEVTVTNACGPTTDQIEVEFVSGRPQPDLGEDIIGCVGQSFTLDATSERATYLWQDGSTGATFATMQAGTYTVTATNVCGETIAELEITLLDSAPTVELGQDSVLCSGDNFQLDVTSLGATYLWQDGSTSAVYPVNTGGTYEVTVTNACGPTTDAVTYEFVSGPPRPNLGDDEVACIGETFLLDATSERATYEWQDGSTGATLSVDQSGLYQVTATNVCGQGTDQVQITFLEGAPVIDLGPDQIRCEGESLQLSAASDQASYNWSNGANTASITVSTSNTYRVSVTNACGQVTDEIEVNFIPKIEVDLGEEQYLCEENFVLDATTHDFVTHRWQDGSTNPIYPVSSPGLYSVEITSACETVVDSVLLIRCENCDVYMPNAFSPNGDGQNDLFQPYTSCELMDFTFRIFDRWGTLVFESTDPLTGWDGQYNGQNLPNGVYVWMIQYTVSENGEIFSENEYGDVAILR